MLLLTFSECGQSSNFIYVHISESLSYLETMLEIIFQKSLSFEYFHRTITQNVMKWFKTRPFKGDS
jgi:hypothetical protein